MEKIKKGIYNELFIQICTKQELSDKFKVTIKTIENRIKECDDIAYSKKLGAYHFKYLLPNYISYHNYFVLFQDNLTNPILKKDFLKITSKVNENLDGIMLETDKFSNLSKKIIKANIAINHNCILKVDYKGNTKPKEEKYIQPNQIVTVGSIYYLYTTYDKKNKKDEGQPRQLTFNSIEDIEPIEYIKDKTFKTNVQGNAYGSYENTSKITLNLRGTVATFFTREGFFDNPNYKFLSELSTNEIEIEMIYNHNIEVIKLVQQWMPQIRIINNSPEANKIIEDITSNYTEFIGA